VLEQKYFLPKKKKKKKIIEFDSCFHLEEWNLEVVGVSHAPTLQKKFFPYWPIATKIFGHWPQPISKSGFGPSINIIYLFISIKYFAR
jgi:hypothetical protein